MKEGDLEKVRILTNCTNSYIICNKMKGGDDKMASAKKEYSKPEAEIVEFETKDIILASGSGGNI